MSSAASSTLNPPPRICLAVSPTCDLPHAFIERNRIKVMPVRIRYGDSSFLDARNPQKTEEFYGYQLARKDLEGESEPLNTAEIGNYLEEHVIQNHFGVLIITINSQRSKIYSNALRCATENTAKFKALRKRQGKFELFRMQVLDSESMFTGEAVMVWEAARMVRNPEVIMSDLTSHLSELRKHVVSYMVPEDLYFLHTRSSTKGDRSVGWLGYKVGSLLNVKPVVRCRHGETEPVDKIPGFDKAIESVFSRAREAIDRGLMIPYVAISYAGNLENFRNHRSYRDFIIYAQKREIHTSLALMSATAAMNVGPGAFSLGYAE